MTLAMDDSAKSKSFRRKESEADECESRYRKRKRTTISPDQLNLLENLYDDQQWPTKIQKEQLAHDLGRSETFVSVWFQNKRARVKKEEDILKKRVGLALGFAELAEDKKTQNSGAANRIANLDDTDRPHTTQSTANVGDSNTYLVGITLDAVTDVRQTDVRPRSNRGVYVGHMLCKPDKAKHPTLLSTNTKAVTTLGLSLRPVGIGHATSETATTRATRLYMPSACRTRSKTIDNVNDYHFYDGHSPEDRPTITQQAFHRDFTSI